MSYILLPRRNRVRGSSLIVDANIEPFFNAAAGDRDLLAEVGCNGSFIGGQGNWQGGTQGGGTSALLGAGTGRLGGSTQAWQLGWSGAAEDLAAISNPDWTPATRLVATFWVKTTWIITDASDNSGIKWLLFRTDPNSGDAVYGRITWGLTSLIALCSGVVSGVTDGGMAFTACSQLDGGGILQNVTKNIGWSTPSHPRVIAVNDGAWHRVTHAANTIDKWMRIWLDGTLVLNSAGFTPNMPAPGYKGIEVGANNPAVITAGSIQYSDFSVFDKAA